MPSRPNTSHSAVRSTVRLALLAVTAAAAVAACAPEQPALTSPADPSIAAAPSAAQPGEQPTAPRAPAFVPGELIVRFTPGTSVASRGALMRAANAQMSEQIVTAAMRGRGDDEGITLLHTTMSVPDAIAALQGRAAVEFAEPNWVYTTDAVANDPFVTDGSLWGMTGTFGSGASAAWDTKAAGGNCGTSVIGIIDEGYYYGHEDLKDNAGTNPGEIAGDRIDNDDNGYVDDVYGYDFANNDNTVFDGTTDDHGTHVAGTIGARGNNGIGVAGVCWSVTLMNAKFLGRNGGTTANAVKAVDYFTAFKAKGMNIVATSNSWGGGGYSQALADAIGRANSAGILFVAAAGNSAVNCDVWSCYPARYTNANVIAVASITSTGALSSFSNYGATSIDLGAPGSGIYSTVPGSTKRKITSAYASYSGTSMATPHVTGAAALYAARHPGDNAAKIKAAILDQGTATASLAGKTVTGKRLNVAGF